jgi:hypothetical protein
MKKKSLGHIKKMTLDLTSPEKMKHIEMEYNALTILCGMNGTGKSFLNTMVYVITNIINFKLIAKDVSNETLQHIFDRCFDKKVCGTIKATYDSNTEIEIVLDEEGKIDKCIMIADEGVQPTKAFYLSTNFRTFNNIKMYLQMRKMIPGTREEKIEHLITQFKMYDVMMIEGLIQACCYEIPETTKEDLIKTENQHDNGMGEFTGVKYFDVNLEKGDFLLRYEDGKERWCTEFGNGHQSILSMFIATSIN